MSIVLPDPMVWVIDLLGYGWPEADEDRLFAAAEAWRGFAAELAQISQDTNLAAVEVGANSSSDSTQAFLTAWSADQRHHQRGIDGSELTAVLLDASGEVTQITKVAILGILAATAAAFIASQVAAPATFGLSEVGAVAAQEAGRQALRRTFRQLREVTTRDLAGSLRQHIDDTLRGINPGAGLRMESHRRRTAGSASAVLAKATPHTRAIPASYPPPRTVNGIPGLSRARPKTPVQGGGGLRARWTDSDGNIYEWDRMHGTLEKYGKGGEHLGEYDPVTGDQTKPAKPGRNIKNYL